MKKEMKLRDARLSSSGESVKDSKELVADLQTRILDLTRKAGTKGITINEAERLIDDHKASSVSPRFAELIKRGLLVRVLVGYGRPTKRFPNGAPLYLTRFDETTRRHVNLHWLPEFAPKARSKAHDRDVMRATNPIAPQTESGIQDAQV